MGAIRAELIKLRRSMSWAVVAAVPLTAVLAGAGNSLAAAAPLVDGWHTLWLRTVVFYGLFPLGVALGATASLVWREEHRAGNRNALMAQPVSRLRIVAAKAVVLGLLAAAMQGVLVIALVLAGKLLFGLPGLPPARHLLVSAVIVLACLPVVAVQSALSMVLRSFAAPVAVALLGAVGSVPLLLAGADILIAVVPYALPARATQLGTGVLADDGVVTAGMVGGLAGASVTWAVLVVAATAVLLDRRG